MGRMDTTDETLPVLAVREGIASTEDGVLLVDGVPVAPGRYRLQLGDADDSSDMPVLDVAGYDDGPEVISLAHLG